MNAQGTPTRKKIPEWRWLFNQNPYSFALQDTFKSEGGKVDPQNKHILLDNDLADLLEIKRRRSRTTINNLMSRHQNNQSVNEVKVNYISICNSNEISNAFNEYSSTIGPRLAHEIPLTSHEMSIYLNNIRPTTTSVVLTHLNRLSKTKAVGLGGISARLIRDCADIISSPLCDLFNKSLMSGIFPDYWIFARVTPSFKKGDSFDLNDYQPTSVTSVVAKVFERIV